MVCLARGFGVLALVVSACACAPSAADADPAACPASPPCNPSACGPIGTHCDYYVHGGSSQPSQLCDCVVAPDGGLAEGVWQCGGCS